MRGPQFCPDCGGPSSVKETRSATGILRRRRICEILACGRRWTTYEVMSANESYGHGVTVVAISTAEIRRIRAALVSIDEVLGRHPAAQIEVAITDGRALASAVDSLAAHDPEAA